MSEPIRISPWLAPGSIRVLPPEGEFLEGPIRRRVDDLWARAVREREGLVDGGLFSLAGVANASSAGIAGRFVEYRYHVAQRMDPSLEAILKVRPLAVTAIVRCAEGLLIGQRPGRAIQDGGSWELIPAGGVEPDSLLPDGRIDPRRQVVKELAEETGVGGIDLESLQPLFWMEEGAVTDLVFTLELAMTRTLLMERFAALPAREHTAIEVVPPERVRAELTRADRNFSASTRALLKSLLSSGRMST
jgi:8-oxo-dGTP pyrophosphatase MutT (NUDIX family)